MTTLRLVTSVRGPVPITAHCEICDDRYTVRRAGPAHVRWDRCPCVDDHDTPLNIARRLWAAQLAGEMQVSLITTAMYSCSACRDLMVIGDDPDTARRCPCQWVPSIFLARVRRFAEEDDRRRANPHGLSAGVLAERERIAIVARRTPEGS